MNGERSTEILYQKMSNHHRINSQRRLSKKSLQTILASVCVTLSVAVVLLGICVALIYMRVVSLETEVWKLKNEGFRSGLGDPNEGGVNFEKPGHGVQERPRMNVLVQQSSSTNLGEDEKDSHPRPASVIEDIEARTAHPETTTNDVHTALSRLNRLKYETWKQPKNGPNLVRLGRAVRETGYQHEAERSICSKHRSCKQKQLQVASFHGHFYSLFPFSSNFRGDAACVPHKDWSPGILGCTNQTVFIPIKETALPFYTEVQKKISGEKKKRKPNIKRALLEHKNGVFTVAVSGDYLIHLNITVVDASETHFLALYVNDRAMLVCPNGGFRCPHANDPGVNKYRICNIGGVLELEVNNTLTIKTMAADMSVRLHYNQKSLLKFVHLR